MSSNFSSGYKVDKTWEGGYYQGGVAQFVLYGDQNQTNISCKIQYYYKSNPLSNNTTLEAVKWFLVPPLDSDGVGIFQFVLNDTNGFDRVGGYNVIFIFGEDVLNETGIQIWEAPRARKQIMVNFNPQYIIDANNEVIAGNKKNIDNALAMNDTNWHLMGWYTVILTIIFFWALYVIYWHSKYDVSITTVFCDKLRDLYSKFSYPLGHLYPLLNSDNFDELRRTGLRTLYKQEKWLKNKYKLHKSKADYFENKLKRTTDDKNVIEGELIRKDPNDPHLWILKQHSDSTIELKEGEISFSPAKVKVYKKLKAKRARPRKKEAKVDS